MTTLQPGVDRRLVASWVGGWALSRGAPPPVPAYDGLRVDVGLPDQKARFVFAAVSPGVGFASREIRDRYVFLKVCGAPDTVSAILADGWSVRPPSFMMVTDDLGAVQTPPAPMYHVQSDHEREGFATRVRTADGEVVASGRVVVVNDVAVFDRIETHAGHRRRGLGRAVMAQLGASAKDVGARTGALVATSDGRSLYAATGWRVASLYTTAVRERLAPPPLT